MLKYVTLVPEQMKELESDLMMESVLKVFEKIPGLKAMFELKTKMFESIRSQRRSFISLLKLLDKVAKVKECLDDTFEISWAVVVPDNDAEAKHSGWGEEDVPAVFKPLLVPPRVNL